MQEPMIRGVVFDAVGTLIYPHPAVASVYASVGRRFGSALAEHEVARRFRKVFREVEERDRAGDLCTSEEFETERWREIVRRVLDDVTDYTGCFAELFEHFARSASWRVYDDVPPALAALQSSGATLAIASNFDQRLTSIAGELVPLKPCTHVLASSQIGYRKPHGQFFAATVAAIGVTAHEVLYIGDDPVNDLAGARSAGLQSLLLCRGVPSPCDALKSLASLHQFVLPRLATTRPSGARRL